MLQLSGGEKARLMLGLATFHAPHLLILDEPTNHLDIDSRSALIEAINDYEGAIILIAHDRHLIDACADRLWLVDSGTVQSFDGDMDDYKKLVLERAGGGRREARRPTREASRDIPTLPAAPPRSAGKPLPLRKQIAAQEERMAKFAELIGRIDKALGEAGLFKREPNKAALLSKQRGELERALVAAEEEWLRLTTQSEAAE